MLAAGPVRRHYNPTMQPLGSLQSGVAPRARAAEPVFDKPGLHLELRDRSRMEPANVP